jgi:hypothetical protein
MILNEKNNSSYCQAIEVERTEVNETAREVGKERIQFFVN